MSDPHDAADQQQQPGSTLKPASEEVAPAPAAESASASVAAPNAGLLIGILVAAAFVVILNETTMAIALPALMADFHITPDVAQWLTTSFMLTMAVVIPTTGYVMERFSLRRVFIFAMLTFLVGTVAAAMAPSFPVLLIARIVQASGTALILPLLMTTIMRLVPVERRGAVLGWVTVVIAVAPAVGPTFAGIVLESLTWHWIFLLMIPLVVIALVAGTFLVRNFEQPTRPTLDILSVLLAAVGFSGLLYGLTGLSNLAVKVPWDRVAILVASALILVVFFHRQVALDRGEATSPLLSLQPLRVREFNLSLVMMLLSFSLLFGFIILMPLYAQVVLGLSEKETGLVSLPGGLLMGLLGPVVGRLYDAKGMRPLIIPGSVLLAASMVGLTFLHQGSTLWELIAYAVLLNLGVALLMTPLMSNALAAVPPQLAAHGQAILNTFQQIAGGAGTAMFVAVMTFASTTYATSHAAEGLSQQAAANHGIHVAFVAGAVLSVIPLLFSIFVRFDVARDKH